MILGNIKVSITRTTSVCNSNKRK